MRTLLILYCVAMVGCVTSGDGHYLQDGEYVFRLAHKGWDQKYRIVEPDSVYLSYSYYDADSIKANNGVSEFYKLRGAFVLSDSVFDAEFTEQELYRREAKQWERVDSDSVIAKSRLYSINGELCLDRDGKTCFDALH